MPILTKFRIIDETKYFLSRYILTLFTNTQTLITYIKIHLTNLFYCFSTYNLHMTYTYVGYINKTNLYVFDFWISQWKTIKVTLFACLFIFLYFKIEIINDLFLIYFVLCVFYVTYKFFLKNSDNVCIENQAKSSRAKTGPEDFSA